MATTSTPEQVRAVYDCWHDGFSRNDLAAIMALYAEHAVIETPTVLAVYPDADEGILRGRPAIEALFAEVLARVSKEFRELFRTGLFLADGDLLMWEYPRATPTGEQLDLVESMDLEDGLIVYHRVYWGWKGYRALQAATVKAASG